MWTWAKTKASRRCEDTGPVRRRGSHQQARGSGARGATSTAMVRTALSRAESVRRYFLTLPASDRADVLTIRDESAAALLGAMQDAQAAGGAARSSFFSLDGLAQRRNLKSYGQWVGAGARGAAASGAVAARRPKPAELRQVSCPPELLVSQRIVDASVRLETELRLDLNSTLSIPVRRRAALAAAAAAAAAAAHGVPPSRPRLAPGAPQSASWSSPPHPRADVPAL